MLAMKQQRPAILAKSYFFQADHSSPMVNNYTRGTHLWHDDMEVVEDTE